MATPRYALQQARTQLTAQPTGIESYQPSEFTAATWRFLHALLDAAGGKELLLRHGEYLARATDAGSDYQKAVAVAKPLLASVPRPQPDGKNNPYISFINRELDRLQAANRTIYPTAIEREQFAIQKLFGDKSFPLDEPLLGALRSWNDLTISILAHVENHHVEACCWLLQMANDKSASWEHGLLGESVGQGSAKKIQQAATALVDELEQSPAATVARDAEFVATHAGNGSQPARLIAVVGELAALAESWPVHFKSIGGGYSINPVSVFTTAPDGSYPVSIPGDSGLKEFDNLDARLSGLVSACGLQIMNPTESDGTPLRGYSKLAFGGRYVRFLADWLRRIRVLGIAARELLPAAAIPATTPQVAPPIPATQSIPEEIRANDYKLFPKGPLKNRDAAELVLALNTHKNTGKTLNQIARDYTGETLGNDSRAMSLMATIRQLKSDGRVCY